MWVDHEELPESTTIEEHHAHEALGSSRLRQYLTPDRPGPGTADMGNAVGWLAVASPTEWDDEGALVKLRPRFSGNAKGLEEWKAANPGVIGLTRKDYGMASAMATALQEHPRFRRIIASPHLRVERTTVARHSETGVMCKARPDLELPGVWQGDIKTTRARDLLTFAYSVSDYGYDMQAALYQSIAESLYGHPMRSGYDLLAVSSTPPHPVFVVSICGAWMMRGRRLLESALRYRQHHEETGMRPPMWWEGRQVLPPPSHRDKMREERICEHANSL